MVFVSHFMMQPAITFSRSAGFFLATPTQEEVFKSIQNNVNQSSDSGRIIPYLMAAGAVIILLALFSQRRKREFNPRAINHQGKLMKEVLRALPLRSIEMKQLKLLCEPADSESAPLHPLTLLICPSLLEACIRRAPVKVDRRIVTQLAKKVGVTPEWSQPAAAVAPPAQAGLLRSDRGR